MTPLSLLLVVCCLQIAYSFAPALRIGHVKSYPLHFQVTRNDYSLTNSKVESTKSFQPTVLNQPAIDKADEQENADESVEMKQYTDEQLLDTLIYQVSSVVLVLTISCVALAAFHPDAALAANSPSALKAQTTMDLFDPSQFQPVCPGSDGVYQILKYTANSLVGADNVVEYGPLIASVLLRIRLELCVLESFIYEAVVPFVRTKGLSWVLPLHETVETVLAGTIFAIASNFILLGSTKILSVLFIYADALTGMPARFLGGQAKRRLNGPGAVVGAGFKAAGDALGAIRGFLEAADTFVGRYLVIGTTIYIAFKICHYKLFNDIFP